MRVLVVNAGSSSLKLRLLDGNDETLAEQEIPALRARVDHEALGRALGSELGRADAVGHRIVHGGEHFRTAVLIDGDVEDALRDLSTLAPLHQPKSLDALDAVTGLLPELPAVACFDTAFHATIPPAAATYALPGEWRERWGLRRYGFHGLSHAWVARRVPETLGRPVEGLRIVSCHLGAGASLCAISSGISIDTTMGFTPLEGLVMATRSGSVDPGMMLWLLEEDRVSPQELADALEHSSGLLGISGTADMAEVLSRAEDGDEAARLALDVYLRSLRANIAAMAAALDGVDVIAFTGGVGERAPQVRERAITGLHFLGLEIDEAANWDGEGDREISAPGSRASTVVLAAREDLEVARQVRAVLAQLRGAREPRAAGFAISAHCPGAQRGVSTGPTSRAGYYRRPARSGHRSSPCPVSRPGDLDRACAGSTNGRASAQPPQGRAIMRSLKRLTPHILQITAGLAMLCAFAVAPVAAQASESESKTTEAKYTLEGGPLTITAPAIAPFTATLKGTAQVAKTAVGAWTINDARGSNAGYSVTVEASPVEVLPAGAEAPEAAAAGSQLAITGTQATEQEELGYTAPVPNVTSQPLSQTPVTIQNAPAGSGQMQWNVPAGAEAMEVVIPGNAVLGVYSSTLTFTTSSPAED